MVEINEVLIWFLFLCISNLIFKRALGVRFWDSFAQSSKVSKSISTIIQLVFLILALSSCFLWIT